ncbi:hypothetical protein ENTCAN_05444 [Enterobacter cancerogenus ATCC 35316]|nr:hypothetical protein ENTCAN_05444 [Enterobacter cancerogenus ATCC 35316]
MQKVKSFETSIITHAEIPFSTYSSPFIKKEADARAILLASVQP